MRSLGRMQPCLPHALSLQMAWIRVVEASMSNGPQNVGYVRAIAFIRIGLLTDCSVTAERKVGPTSPAS
jgi:hypothetical protein